MRRPVLVALLLLAVVCVLPRIGLAGESPDGNLLVFQDYGEKIAHGAVPYRDFRIEYPPGAIPAMVVPALLPWSYATSFALVAALTAAAAIVLVALLLVRLGASTRQLYAGTAFVPLAMLAFGGIALQRFDFWPALLTLAALAALLADRPRWAFAALAAGALAKLYPLALVPLAVVWVWRHRGRREAFAGVAIFCAIGLVVLVPFAALAHAGLYNSFAQQTNRHLQLETLGSSVLLAAHDLGASFRPHVVSDAGANTLQGTWPDRLATFHSLLQAFGLLLVWGLFARLRRPGPRELVAAATAGVAVFAICGKLLSPQFLLWLVPMVPLLPAGEALVAAALLVPALVLSQVVYPHFYEGLTALHSGPVWALVARNVFAAALVVMLVAGVRAARRSQPAAGFAAAAPRPPS